MNKPTPDPIPAEIVAQFSEIDVACISDVLEALGLNCVTLGLRPLDPTWKICGTAVTMRLVPLQDRHDWEQELSAHVLIDMSKPGDVCMIDMGGRVDVAPWGGNTAKDGKTRGVNGVVIDGACRDSEQIVGIGFPTFTRGTCSSNSHGKTLTTCLNSEAVQIGTISVAPGDLVIGDRDAIVVVPAGRTAEVLRLAQKRHELDAGTFDLMRDEVLDRASPEYRKLRAENRRDVLESYGLNSSRGGLGLELEKSNEPVV